MAVGGVVAAAGAVGHDETGEAAESELALDCVERASFELFVGQVADVGAFGRSHGCLRSIHSTLTKSGVFQGLKPFSGGSECPG